MQEEQIGRVVSIIQFKAEEKSMKIIKKMVEDFGSEHFVDNQAIPKTLRKLKEA